MKVFPTEGLMRTILSDLHPCRTQSYVKSYLKNKFNNSPLFIYKDFSEQTILGWYIFFGSAVLPAFTLLWLEHTKKPSWHFLLPLNARGLMHVCLGLMTHAHWSSQQALSVHFEDQKSGWQKVACCNRDSQRATDCPGLEARRPAGRQIENEITPP